MLYWLNNKSEKNNVVILSKTAILLGSCDTASCESVDAQLQKNANPVTVLGKGNLSLIPFQRLQNINSDLTKPAIEIGIQTAKGIVNKTLNFSDFAAREKCFLYLKQLNAKSRGQSQVNTQGNVSKTGASPVSKASMKPSIKASARSQRSVKKAASSESNSAKGQQNLKKKPSNTKMAMMSMGLVASLVGGYFAYTLLMPQSNSLYKAVQTKDLVSVDIQAYLKEGADINYHDADGITPLLSAINHGKENLVVALVNEGADLDNDYNGDTALDIAIASGLDNAVTSMLDKKAPSRNSEDLIIRAIQNKLSISNLNKIVLLGYDVNYINDNGSSVLATALLFGAQDDVVKLLLEKGASTAIKVNGVSPAEFVQSRGNMQLASLLTQY